MRCAFFVRGVFTQVFSGTTIELYENVHFEESPACSLFDGVSPKDAFNGSAAENV